jgi:hypothetical protein
MTDSRHSHGRYGRHAGVGLVDNYLGLSVRADGSLLYRGPKTGQYGPMLIVLALYVNYGGDPALLLRQRTGMD